MQIPILNELIIIFGLSIVVVFFSHRIRVPAIVGFLLTGIVAGPHGLGLVKSIHEVEILAEIGVILLLFAIGIEFSLNNLLRINFPFSTRPSLSWIITIILSSDCTGKKSRSSLIFSFSISIPSTQSYYPLILHGSKNFTVPGT